MTNKEKWLEKYKNSWCTEEQLQRLVNLGVLSQEEYNEIVAAH